MAELREDSRRLRYLLFPGDVGVCPGHKAFYEYSGGDLCVWVDLDNYIAEFWEKFEDLERAATF